MKKILSIAGSDSGGGAGIQADLKTITMLGAYGASVITAITAQNTKGVQNVYEVSLEAIAAQLDSVCTDMNFQAVKIGMLANGQIAALISDKIRQYQLPNVVVDPVMVATSGDLLLAKEAIHVYLEKLLPNAKLVTPNMQEAEVLSGLKVRTINDMEKAAEKIAEECRCSAVLVKGGHLADQATDVLYYKGLMTHFSEARIITENSHGTGCTLSSALATYLGFGLSMEEAVGQAKTYLTKALFYGKNMKVGHGHGPVMHNFHIQ